MTVSQISATTPDDPRRGACLRAALCTPSLLLLPGITVLWSYRVPALNPSILFFFFLNFLPAHYGALLLMILYAIGNRRLQAHYGRPRRGVMYYRRRARPVIVIVYVYLSVCVHTYLALQISATWYWGMLRP